MELEVQDHKSGKTGGELNKGNTKEMVRSCKMKINKKLTIFDSIHEYINKGRKDVTFIKDLIQEKNLFLLVLILKVITLLMLQLKNIC